jgi:hypothetical protein
MERHNGTFEPRLGYFWGFTFRMVPGLNYICMLLNHVTRERLNWYTPIEWLLRYTPDITVFLVFLFWEGVHYKKVEPAFRNTPEKFR